MFASDLTLKRKLIFCRPVVEFSSLERTVRQEALDCLSTLQDVPDLSHETSICQDVLDLGKTNRIHEGLLKMDPSPNVMAISQIGRSARALITNSWN